MGVSVGTTGKQPKVKWHCECLMSTGKTAFIMVKAETASEASAHVHNGYKGVEVVLDILTHEQMDRKKKHLKPSILGAVSSY